MWHRGRRGTLQAAQLDRGLALGGVARFVDGGLLALAAPVAFAATFALGAATVALAAATFAFAVVAAPTAVGGVPAVSAAPFASVAPAAPAA